MKKETIRKIAEGTIKKVIEPFYVGGAAELAFWLLLSLMPATILLAQLLQLFTLTMDAVKNMLGIYLTEEIQGLIVPLLQYTPRGGVTIFLILMALWAGSSAVFTLMRITNRAYGFLPKKGSPVTMVIIERLRSILLTLLILLTMIFTFYVVVFGELIIQAVITYNSIFLGNEYTFSEVWLVARWLIAFGLFFLMTYSIYNILPRAVPLKMEPVPRGSWPALRAAFKAWLVKYRIESRRAVPGSIFSAVSMLIVTWIYTIYIRNITNTHFNILYGGLSSVVVLLLWFYIISFIVIIGIQLNATWAEYGRMHEK